MVTVFGHINGQSDLFRDQSELFHHCRHHVFHGLGPSKLIGVRKEISVQILRIRRQIGNQSNFRPRGIEKLLPRAQPRILNRLRDIEHRVALGNDNRVNINVPAHKPIVNLGNSRRLFKKIFAGLQRMVGMKAMPQEKCEPVPDHSRRLEFGRDATG